MSDLGLMSCGHPHECVWSSKGGTHHCRWCAEVGDLRADRDEARAELVERSETVETLARELTGAQAEADHARAERDALQARIEKALAVCTRSLATRVSDGHHPLDDAGIQDRKARLAGARETAVAVRAALEGRP